MEENESQPNDLNFENRIPLEALQQAVNDIKAELAKVIIGQENFIELLIVSLLVDGHVLIEGVPGIAKTVTAKLFAKTLKTNFNRIQFTPDLMPSDILGSEVLDQNRKFQFVKGPVFANIILADEINRTPPKTQAALLEAMQERAVTITGKRYELSLPYFVLATQNPIEQEGTYPLPEAQLDRFMFAIELRYPSHEEEIQVVKSTTNDETPQVNALYSAQEILDIQHLVRRIPVPDNVVDYAVKLVSKTRPGADNAPEIVKQFLDWGAGPRASQYLILGAKAHAAINGKFSPDIEDVQAIALSILRHRIIKNYKAEAEGITEEALIGQLL